MFDGELFDDRYLVYRRDRETSGFHRSKSGGGVLIAVSKHISSRRLPQLESDCEDLWVELEVRGNGSSSHKLLLCGVYLPPPLHESILDCYVDNVSRILESNEKVLIVGDFNSSNIIWNNQNLTTPADYIAKSALDNRLLDFIALNNLAQFNNILNDKGKVLDLVLSNTAIGEVKESNFPLSNLDSYHPALEFSTPFSEASSLRPKDSNGRYNFYKADYDAIVAQLNATSWTHELSMCSVDSMVDTFYCILRDVIAQHVPKYKPPSKRYPIWFTKELTHLLKEKHKTRTRFRKYKNPLDEIALCALKRKCAGLVSICYQNYITHLEESICDNPKLFWTFLKNKKRNSNAYPTSMTLGSARADSGDGICDLFASFFASVFRASSTSSLSASDQILTSNYLTNLYFTQEDVLNALTRLNRGKGAGPDGIPPIFVVNCREALALPLSTIFNASLKTGTFPSAWKEARIVPIFKSGDAKSVKNYRPISILCVFGKILESLVCPMLTWHMKQIISPQQFGFLKSRSTNTNLVSFLTQVSESLDARLSVDTIYTDISKAFDTVDHIILLHKLSTFGITGDLLAWFSSYLQQRKSRVVIGGFSSAPFQCTSGVPQGSHLGPILFNIFINDIVLIFRHAQCFLYADDMKLSMQIREQYDTSLLQEDLDRLVVWCDDNQLFMNLDKCKFIRFSRCSNVAPPAYNINGYVLEEVESIRDLGVLLDKKLRFHRHIDQIVNKGFQMLGFVLRNAKDFKKTSTKIMLYRSLVCPNLEYCSQVWSPHYDVHIKRIERIQKRFMWHLSYQTQKAKELPSYEERLAYFKLNSLKDRRFLLDLMLLYRIVNGTVDCSSLLRLINLNVPYKMARVGKYVPFCVRGCRTNVGHHATVNRLQRHYNKLCKLSDVDIFTDKPQRFRRQILQFLNARRSDI